MTKEKGDLKTMAPVEFAMRLDGGQWRRVYDEHGITAVVKLIGTRIFEVLPLRNGNVLGPAKQVLEIVARAVETSPDPIWFTQNLFQYDRESAESCIEIAMEVAEERAMGLY